MIVNKESIAMIKKFSNANGVSGFEDEVLAVAREYASEQYTLKEDHLRNLYFDRKDNDCHKPSILLDAHSDEVGLIVQAIKPNGTMSFLALGGWVANSLPASKVRVRNEEGKYISGIIASKPPHFMANKEQTETLQLDQMVLDIGASSKDEVLHTFKINIGAPIVPDVSCTYDEEKDLFIGKAFDCRIGCAALMETLKRLEKETLDVNVLATLSAQEEVGERGMNLITKTIHPDIAIVFEGCPADDTFQEEWLVQSAMRKGVMLRHFDKSMITNPRYQKFALSLAKVHHIPCQESVRSGGGTNGAMLHMANQGTPAIVIGIPVRYIHSHHGFTTYEDFEYAVQLAVLLVKAMNADTIASF
ncbi:MAG: M42 family peptidase [Erysipelotrichia bacterium]|nr:M42 family peptidase [Erysipelotrichia bacterium]NCC55280.1 M42 family peptidase [Erysipelotrichia bacterium]